MECTACHLYAATSNSELCGNCELIKDDHAKLEQVKKDAAARKAAQATPQTANELIAQLQQENAQLKAAAPKAASPKEKKEDDDEDLHKKK